MNKYLLDTHIVIFALRTPEKLSAAVRDAVLSGNCVLSIVAFWEVVIKDRKGAIDVGDPRVWWPRALDVLAAAQLPIHADHVKALWTLPDLHKDPFDRILMAQAIAEDLTLVTADAQIARYASAGLRIIS